MKIIGAGLSGLIAAHAFPKAQVLEGAPEPNASHKALLRFRSDAVANLVGVEFTPVEVHKGIWFKGEFHPPSILLANLYSRKVIGRVADRSIWNLAPVKRFIAPENLYDQLVDAVGSRISWNVLITNIDKGAKVPLLSTMPLPSMLAAAKIEHNVAFERQPITVARFRVANCHTHQTVYFPDPDTPVYRASLTGSLLTVETVTDNAARGDIGRDVLGAFGLTYDDILQSLGTVEQRYGKIAPIDDEQRKQLLFRLTHEHNVFSVGRFAIWKNILLDDVVHDLAVVRRLMRTSSYDQRHAAQ